MLGEPLFCWGVGLRFGNALGVNSCQMLRWEGRLVPGYYMPVTCTHISMIAHYPYPLPISRGIAGIRV